MKYKVLFEASGSLTSAYLIKSAKNAGAVTVGSDISECAGQYLADEFILFPKISNPNLWEIMEEEILSRKINVVIPSFDETLLE